MNTHYYSLRAASLVAASLLVGMQTPAFALAQQGGCQTSYHDDLFMCSHTLKQVCTNPACAGKTITCTAPFNGGTITLTVTCRATPSTGVSGATQAPVLDGGAGDFSDF